ncbi:non-ribosomal peptide synthetase [Brasilonema sp. UFV-L1]|uniref:amino acid adenylation domain-containing protein n=1 Tax=Brasilonema sp. UFV-L1 TaxID=2234130 RepID=UPI00145DC9E6|nr:non-ribosomal peptide synthetase [Brasilonema sp. UFV-L1]NMG07615.1 non-ribosomal peptide synthetase [Brasilonema sp. UFV-L1]
MQNQSFEGFRLSPQQKHLWLLQQNSMADRAQCVLLLEGRLKIEILKEALEKIVNRHEILRTIFHRRSGLKIPIQVINDSSKPSWQTFNLSDIDARQQQVKIEELFLEERKFPFDLEGDSLLRVSLLILSANQHMLLITLPSLCADSWTLKNLVKEIAYTYGQCLNDEELYDEPVQYLQFSEWQNELLEDEDAEAGRDYWRQQSSKSPPLLTLPFEKQSSGETKFEPNVLSLRIESAVVARLENIAKLNNNIKITEFLFACWQTLIWRLTRQPNIVINTIFSSRQYEELHETLGLLAKWLPIRCDFQNDFKFNEILTKISKSLHDGDQLQKYFMWEQNIETTSKAVNFPLAFEFQKWSNKYDVGGVSFSVEKQYVCFERFKVKLTCVHREEFLTAEIHYDPETIDLEGIQYLGQQFKTLVESAVNNPEAEVSKLDIFRAREREKLLFDFNQTRIDFPLDKCIHQLFEEQVEKTPNSIAVIFENQQLTYAELNARANQLARYLQNLGVKPEDLVGIYLERSPLITIGLLGILKAGGAYLPLDPTLPISGLDFRLHDAGAKILLTQEQLVKNLPESETKVVCLERDWDIIANEASNNLHCELTPDNLVYVIYTSGSTGKPKGVAIEHRQLLNYLYGIQKILNLTPGNSFALVSTFAADLGNTVIFPALCTGGCLHVISFERASDAQALADYFQEHPIDFLKIVPSHLKALLLFEYPAKILPRRQLILGGEATNWKLIEQIQQLAPECQIINHYGPTETTVGVLTYQVEKVPDSRQSSTVPIGCPLANTQIYILDSKKQPTPIGVPGEVYIGGAGLARGYLNRPELTAEKFILNPFNDDPQARLYKTGDLARYLSNDNIEFLGRIDQQVKIRGFRIEPGEIEAVLSSYPHIEQAVVIATEDTPDDKRLVAYIVSDNQDISIHQLREFLQQELPAYMVPAAFVILDTLPLTPNGKIDRLALPAPEEKTRTGEYVAPHTPSQEIIAHIFGELLGVETVSIHDNFFELGGHSLLATQLISRLRHSFEVEIPLKAIFAAPSVAQLDQTIAQLRTQGQSLNLPPIERIAPNTEKIPLSFAQERLWFLNQLEGASATYNTPAALRLSGALNLNALHQALAEIIRRHEALRTSFANINGTPMQVIHPEASMDIEVVNLQHLEQSERELVVEQQLQRAALAPFNLESAPLIRCSLWQLSDSDYVFGINMHHIVSDGWSIGVLIQELSALYKAFCTGESSPLPNLEIQYADFALWQRQWLSKSVLEKQMQYWVSQLQGAPELLQLPTDRPRPSMQTYKGATQSFGLNQELTQKLKSLSRRAGSTLFMTLLSAFATLLYRYSGQSDVVIGSPIANRHRSEIEPLIGFFVNTLVLRTQLDDNLSFQQLLAQVRETTLQAYEHQDVPFEQVVEALQPQRSMSHSPLFQVMFVLQNAPMGELELPGVSLSGLEQERTIAKFDLTVSMSETSAGLGCEWEYNTDLFDRSTIERMTSHFENLLSAIASNPQQRVSELPLLSTAERQQLLFEWNDTNREYPLDKCIHQLFEEQVERTPDAVAVVFEKQQLTYQQLNARANQLAHYLQTLGVGPEVLVGICVERSVEMVVGLLGILKAGGAYVPVDPTYPQERLSYMLRDAGVKVLLTQENLLSSVPSHTAQMVCLDTDWQPIKQHSQENLITGAGAENLAYVIYTSGSTGQPKGVMNTRQGIRNRLLWMQEAYQLTSSDRVLQKTPFSFDVSVWEFFWPLLTGARIVVARPEGHKDSNYLINLIAQEQVTTIHFVPSMLQAFLQEDSLEDCSSLRRVFCSGEALSFELKERFFEYFECEFYNLYGPTEAAIDVTFWRCQPQLNCQLVPIGRPIANTQIYILDQQMQPVPIGVTGELYIGGDGLARGYLNRPELTQERFVLNPFSPDKSARLYKTGDLARYLCDGNIEYIGRIDHQVKIRGFRIELGEIEAVLSSHPQIQQAVVIASVDNFGNKRLIAYVVSESETFSTHQLREFLQQQLPAYMMPSAFVSLNALPLSPNGKIDRKPLPTPDGDIEREGEYVAPRTPSEEIIAHIFAEVLAIETVGVHDNFFELGGHSLLATQLVSRLKQSFEVKIPLKAVFAAPSVAQLNQAIAQLRAEGQSLNLPPIERIAPDIEKIPLSFAQERLWLLDQLESDSVAYNMPAAVRIEGKLQPTALERSISEIIRRHEVLRTNFVKQDGQAIQIIHPVSDWQMTTIDLQSLSANQRETEIQSLATTEAAKPFNLATDSLIRGTLLALSDSEHVLLLTMHHIVSDGWSIGVFIQELTTLYCAFVEGKPLPLPELPIQYADFAVWQRQWLQGEELQKQLNYWQKQLAGAPALLELPTDYPRPAVQTFRGARQSLQLSKTLIEEIKTLSRQERVTLFVTLFATFTCLLYYYTGQEDIVVGTAVANRNRAEIEKLIGFFVNQLVFRIDLTGNPTFGELLERVREVALEADAHQDLPFETLVRAMKLERNPSRTPLFQIKLVFQNTPVSDLNLSELNVNLIEVDNETTKFDLLLNMEETQQGLSGSLQYNTALYESTTITQFLEQFKTLLSKIVAQPNIRLNTIKEILSEADRQRQLVKEQEVKKAAVQKLKKSNRRISNNSTEKKYRL